MWTQVGLYRWGRQRNSNNRSINPKIYNHLISVIVWTIDLFLKKYKNIEYYRWRYNWYFQIPLLYDYYGLNYLHFLNFFVTISQKGVKNQSYCNRLYVHMQYSETPSQVDKGLKCKNDVTQFLQKWYLTISRFHTYCISVFLMHQI